MQEQEESIFELKEDVIPKKISAFIEELMKADEKQTHATKSSITYVIDGDKCIGEYTMINESVIHVLAFKREISKSKQKKMENEHDLDSPGIYPHRRIDMAHVGFRDRGCF